MARTKVARTRLSPEENEQFEADAAQAGLTPSEYLRRLILGERERENIEGRITALDKRLEHVESQVADMWAREVREP